MDRGETTAFQITPQGEAFLTREAPPESRPALPLAVAPDLTIQTPLEGSLYDQFQRSLSSRHYRHIDI